MLDQVIHKHLDVMDKIQDRVEAAVDEMMQNLDIDVILENPEESLLALVEYIKSEIADKYIQESIKAGESLEIAIRKDGEIVISDSDNPRENDDKAIHKV